MHRDGGIPQVRRHARCGHCFPAGLTDPQSASVLRTLVPPIFLAGRRKAGRYDRERQSERSH